MEIRDGWTDPKVRTTAVTTKTQETPLLDEGYHSGCEDPILPSVRDLVCFSQMRLIIIHFFLFQISTQSSREDDGLKLQLENLKKKNTELLEKFAVALEQLECMKLSSANN